MNPSTLSNQAKALPRCSGFSAKAASGKFTCPLLLLIICALISFESCTNPEPNHLNPKRDYIRPIAGVDEPLPAELVQRGEILIAYSDCYTCHIKDKRSKGPAFSDIAKRYPRNNDFINMLAYKVISVGKGAWGAPVMDPHPNLTLENAKAMVSYILSMEK